MDHMLAGQATQEERERGSEKTNIYITKKINVISVVFFSFVDLYV